MNTIKLTGCTPNPLAFYLKALGILRLVAEQKDSTAKGCWRQDEFLLQTVLDDAELVEFFVSEYRPTPILVPWSGGDFFHVNRDLRPEELKAALGKCPTSSAVIEAFLGSATTRLEHYRTSLHETLRVMEAAGVLTKKDIEGSGGSQKRKKVELLQALRNHLSDDVVDWIDAAAIIAEDGFRPNNLLGSGGGSDGNSHFSDNFMQALWSVLPDFDWQRKKPLVSSGGVAFCPRTALAESLFARGANSAQLSGLSPVLFDPRRVGGPNSASGFGSSAASNPWDFILMVEGSCLFAGALAKKCGASRPGVAEFPFLLAASPVGAGSLGEAESQGKELWLPLWSSPTSHGELRELVGSARMESRRRAATCGTDAVQALTQYGVDRGIQRFERIGLFRGRIGGDNYFTTAGLGQFVVSRNRHADLLADFDPWLVSYRDKAKSERAPSSATRGLRQLEASIIEFCRQGEARRAQDVLVALGACEQAMARSMKWTAASFLRPVHPLSSRWLKDTDDGTAEFRLAACLASVWGRYGDLVIPLRQHLEPVKTWLKQGKLDVAWEEHAERNVVWHGGNVVAAMNAVMSRRLVLAMKAGAGSWMDHGRLFTSLSDVAAFIEGRIDQERFAELLWGLCLLDWSCVDFAFSHGPEVEMPGAAFALMKLCFAGTSVRGVSEIPLVPTIHQRAAVGDGATATQLASRRLRGSGLPPAVEQVHQQGEPARRTAASLLFPLSISDIQALARVVLRPEDATD